MTDKITPAGAELVGPAAFGNARSRVAFALLMAALLAIAVLAAAWLVRDVLQVWIIAAGGILALLGLFLLVGSIPMDPT